VESICHARPFVLLEEIAHEISRKLLEDRRIAGLQVRLRKQQPFDSRISAVGIEIQRRQGES
jgi:dihydroneopterin aldolase